MTMPNGNETEPGTPVEPAGQPEPQGQAIQPEYVTREQLETFVDELKGTFTEAYRGVQSQNDRAVSKMQQIQQQIAQSLQGFPGATPEQIQQFSREKAIESLFEQQPPAQPGTAPGQEQPPAQPGTNGTGQQPAPSEPTHWTEPITSNLVETFGFDIEESDPEYADLAKLTEAKNPMDFIDGYRQALTAKAERTKKQLPARMPATASVSSPPADKLPNDPDQLFEMAKKAGRI